MTTLAPDPSDAPAYCFYRTFEPRPPAPIAFARHYLLCAVEGAVGFELDGRRWTLPPSFAAWIPERTALVFSIERSMTSCSVLFRSDFLDALSDFAPPDSTTVFAIDALAREMLRYSRRWGPDDDFDAAAEPFFETLARVCAELAAVPVDAWRPIARDVRVARALDYTEANLAGEITLGDVAAAANLSERTLGRLLASEVGLTWAQSLRRVRMIRAMELLGDVDEPVTSVALRVGYASLSSFERAFREFAGDSPSGFRLRRRTRFESDAEDG